MVHQSKPCGARCLWASVLHVAVDDLLGDAFWEFDRELILIDLRDDAVAKDRVRDVIANCVVGHMRGRRRSGRRLVSLAGRGGAR
jgi:hypothetical protein